MAENDPEQQDGLRSMAEDGTQETPQATPGGVDAGRSSYGPSTAPGGEQQPRQVQPIEGRRESADVDQSGNQMRRDGATVGGATGPVENDEMKAQAPEDTERGRVASPADEQPAAETSDEEGDVEGTGPAHIAGTPKGESGGT